MKNSPISDLMTIHSAALHLLCVYKRTEDGGQSYYNFCSAAITPVGRAKRQMQREEKN
jgi:hypothetical protein